MDYAHSLDFPSRVEGLMQRHHVPGLAIAIVQGERTFSAGYGMASLDPPKPCTPDTLFDIASCSKSLTAASVGLLVHDNERYPEVQYEATMSSLLPEDFVMPGKGYTEGVTVEDILSHRTGMPSHDLSYLSPRAARPDDARSVTRNLRNLPLSAPIRSKYMYNNMMYTAATYLVEKKSGLSFSDFLQEHFFGPLNMRSTNLQPERARAMGLGDRIATGYIWEDERDPYHGFQAQDCPEAQGAGSIITSVNDYIKWVKAMMQRDYPVNEDIYRGLIRMRTLKNPDAINLEPLTSPTVYGAGWEIFYYRGHMVVGHDGSVPGFGSRHFFVPDFKLGGAIFGNSSDARHVATILSRELVDAALGVTKSERLNWSKVLCNDSPDEDDPEDDEEKLRQAFCPGIKEPEPQKVPLSAYTGEYRNLGYDALTVEIMDDKLFVDATDRSVGYSLSFDHVCEQTKYIAHLSYFEEGGDIPFRAEFAFENNRAIKMGLHLEPKFDELVWFDRVVQEDI
ncbi:beta-lactamase family protein [Xylariaceae sp. FL1651]|nr:beta-lactamase family protein [Xylariaceae sp. FL1651]